MILGFRSGFELKFGVEGHGVFPLHEIRSEAPRSTRCPHANRPPAPVKSEDMLRSETRGHRIMRQFLRGAGLVRPPDVAAARLSENAAAPDE